MKKSPPPQPQLPPDVLRLIYKMVHPHTQASMKVLNKSTVRNQLMPAPRRSYLQGTGKHQKLWNTLPKKLTTITRERLYLPETLATIGQRIHGQSFPGQNSDQFKFWIDNWNDQGELYTLFLRGMIGVYKETKTGESQIVDVGDVMVAAVNALNKLRQTREFASPMHFTRTRADVYFKVAHELQASLPEKMQLETLMDKALLFLENKHAQMKYAHTQALDAVKNRQMFQAPGPKTRKLIQAATKANSEGLFNGIKTVKRSNLKVPSTSEIRALHKNRASRIWTHTRRAYGQPSTRGRRIRRRAERRAAAAQQ
jgi:hypothetical protein